ncbi:NUDIX hydrolase [Cytobacillus oceanisediminis]|uniref:NUDIX hydrolase n=1 Tax=Cytobacillus oceanisediminis TaxID=665099 RepID=UPI00254D2132|nr:NUDIX domain-containing protein [Cytobacillus oceanisediminis]MDK7667436.1 NUDIX domain-containing protein [Cytobacillus oceanisediminis]
MNEAVALQTKTDIVIAIKGLIIHQGKALILQRADHDDVGAGTWECVGGKLEFGEEIEGSLIREVKEEAGIDISIEKLLYATTFQTDPTRQVVVLKYLCSCQTDTVLLSDEHKDFRWVPKDEAKQLLSEGILHDFEKHGIFRLKEWK